MLFLTIVAAWTLSSYIGYWGLLVVVPVALWIVPGFSALYAITRVTITSGQRKCASIRSMYLTDDGTPCLEASFHNAKARLAVVIRPLPMVGLSNVLF